MSIYSTLFAYGSTIPTSLGTLYTVPSGSVAVIRDIEVQNYSGANAVFTIQFNVSGLDGVVLNYQALPNGNSAQWKGRVVVPGGGLIQGVGSSADQAYSISGYLLS